VLRRAGLCAVMVLAALAVATHSMPGELADQRLAGGLGRPTSDDAPPRTGMEARIPAAKQGKSSSTSTTLPDAPAPGGTDKHHHAR